MKATELRIGNYVNYIFRALSINVPDYKIENGADIQVHQNHNCFKPIPLTEQWLKDFGFADKGTIFKKGWFELWYSSYAENYQLRIYKVSSTFEKIINVEFVHTLQNLFFSLTKIELTKK